MMTATVTERVTYRQVFAEPRFRLLFLTRSLAIGADALRILALSTLIFALTGSTLLAAATFGIGFVPQAIGGTLLGALADRVPPRPLITVGYSLEAATATVLALADLPAGASLALVAVIACLTPVFGGASSRLVAEALTGDAYVLGRSVFSIASATAQLAGLAAGGLTVATIGARHALLVTAGCHLAAAVAIRLRLPNLPAARKPGAQQAGSVFRQSLAGSRLLLGDRAIRLLLLANWLPPAFITGAEGLIVPYVARRGFAAGSAGPLLACLAVGMIVGDLVVGRLLRPVMRERLTIPLMLIAGLPLLAFAARLSLAVSAGLLIVTGTGLAYVLGLQRRFLDAVPEPIRGHAFGLQSTGVMTLQGVGPVMLGALAEVTSIGQAMALAGAATAVTALWLQKPLSRSGGASAGR